MRKILQALQSVFGALKVSSPRGGTVASSERAIASDIAILTNSSSIVICVIAQLMATDSRREATSCRDARGDGGDDGAGGRRAVLDCCCHCVERAFARRCNN